MAALETQGELEWCKNLFMEMTDAAFRLEERERHMGTFPSWHVVDAKSLYDHVVSQPPGAGVQDKRAGIDLVLLKECLSRTQSLIRSAPDSLQLADVMTKDEARTADTFWAISAKKRYGILPEEIALKLRAEAKEARQERGKARLAEQSSRL